MRRPNSTSNFRDESVSAKWNDLKDWEKDMNGLNSGHISPSTNGYSTVTDGFSLPANGHSTANGGYSPVSAKVSAESPKVNLTTKEKFVQFKKQSTRRFVNIKNTISGKYKRADEYKEEDQRSEVSRSPAGNHEKSDHSLPGNCGPGMKSFSNVGRGIKASKSLQNLEQITKDSWRQMADRTSYIGQNLKHKCSSKVDINKLAPKMNYESLSCEDSDEENRPTDNFY